MHDNLLDIFLQECFTHEELARRIRVSKMVLECVYYKLEGSDVTPEDRLPQCLNITALTPEDATFISMLLEKKYLAEDMLYLQLRTVAKQSTSLPTITITTAVPLETNQQKIIGIWLRTNIKPRIMFRTLTDPSSIAGCSLSWHGAYKDYSIRSQFENKREKLRTIINNSLSKYDKNNTSIQNA